MESEYVVTARYDNFSLGVGLDAYICLFCGDDVLGDYCVECVFVCDECFEKKHVRERVRPCSPSMYPGGFELGPEYCEDCVAEMAIPDIKEPE